MTTFITNTNVQSNENNSEDNKLCENTDCERFPPDWGDEDTEEMYEEGEWKKCTLCIGYFNDDGLGDILFIEEKPNNKNASCDLCGKDKNIVQMKGTGEYICGNACDESEDDNDCIFNYYICKYCCNITVNNDPNCSKCDKEMCMELFQDVNESAALSQAKKKYEINDEEVYQLQNTYKKSIYQCEHWNNALKNGKNVRYEITTFFRWGTFEVELTKKEVNELLLKDEIILNDIPGCSIQELWNGCDRYEEIVNKEKYTEDELKEIHRLLFFNDKEPDCYDSECDDTDEDLLEYNGWSMDDTIYGISSGGCTLEIMSD